MPSDLGLVVEWIAGNVFRILLISRLVCLWDVRVDLMYEGTFWLSVGESGESPYNMNIIARSHVHERWKMQAKAHKAHKNKPSRHKSKPGEMSVIWKARKTLMLTAIHGCCWLFSTLASWLRTPWLMAGLLVMVGARLHKKAEGNPCEP